MTGDEMRPFWRYYGGKWQAAPRYGEPLSGVPIIEPFAGAAGYATRYGADRDVILVERDPKIAAIWRWLIEATPEDVRAIPDMPDGGTVDDIDVPDAVRWLIGFWCNDGAAQPCKSPSKWACRSGGSDGPWGGWGDKSRNRIASQVPQIKRWTVIEGTYSDAPDILATWFIDPPYSTPAGRHYKHHDVDYDALGAWCKTRQGRVIACEQDGATWLPFKTLGTIQTARVGKPSKEVIWKQDTTEMR